VARERADVYDPAAIRRHAEGFGKDVFLGRMRDLIAAAVAGPPAYTSAVRK
jgi:hypothetical protein